MDIRLKRAYEPPARADGARILVERLWPRGVGKAALALDLWLHDIAPSPGLRQWEGHEPSRFDEFVRRYQAEAEANAAAVGGLRDRLRRGRTTLLYARRLPEQAVEPGLVRDADDAQYPHPGTLAEGLADVGDHAQVAQVPAGDVLAAVTLRRGVGQRERKVAAHRHRLVGGAIDVL